MAFIMSPHLQQHIDAINNFCRRWKVNELSVFGSTASGTERKDSDIDLMVSFADGAEWSLLDHAAMQQELSDMLGRPVDLVTRQGVEKSENWIRKRHILNNAEIIYRAA